MFSSYNQVQPHSKLNYALKEQPVKLLNLWNSDLVTDSNNSLMKDLLLTSWWCCMFMHKMMSSPNRFSWWINELRPQSTASTSWWPHLSTVYSRKHKGAAELRSVHQELLLLNWHFLLQMLLNSHFQSHEFQKHHQ